MTSPLRRSDHDGRMWELAANRANSTINFNGGNLASLNHLFQFASSPLCHTSSCLPEPCCQPCSPCPCGSAGCLLCPPPHHHHHRKRFPTRRVNSALRSDQSSGSARTVVHTQHPGGFPPAGAIKGAAHRRSDCRAYSRGA